MNNQDNNSENDLLLDTSKELKLGVMTNNELAEWFGIKTKTFTNTRVKKLEELKEYATFEAMSGKGKVNILEIKIPVYVKKTANYMKVKSHIDENWSDNGLDKKKNVAERIFNKKDEYHLNLKYSTTYAYTCKGSNELYGSAREPDKGGEIGNCRYVLCVEDRETKELRWFTKEEFQKKIELKEKYLRRFDSEEYQEIKASILLKQKDKNLSKAEKAIQIYELEHEAYENYLNELAQYVHGSLTYATYRKLNKEEETI